MTNIARRALGVELVVGGIGSVLGSCSYVEREAGRNYTPEQAETGRLRFYALLLLGAGAATEGMYLLARRRDE